jgi:hypothetical protein
MLSRTTLAVVLLSAPVAVRANLITNSGFETGNFTGWTFSGGGNVGCNDGNAHSGNCSALMFFGSLVQNITTMPGGSYTLDFWFEDPQAFLSVKWNGSVIFTSNAGDFSSYTHEVFSSLTATAASTALEFDPSGGVGAGMHLDDVNLVANATSPEPSTFGLVLCAFASAGLWHRLRRRSR